MNAPALPRIPLLDLDLLRTLLAIAETGNFSAAGAEVGRTPSAISMQVRRMEEILGKPVFTRDSRSVTLTPDGEALLAHARKVLALNREIMARFITPEIAGEVRLGAPDDIAERFLPAMLRRFAESHPGVIVNVVVDGSLELMEMVRAGRLDMGLVTCEAGFRGADAAEVIYREQLVWAGLKGGCAADRDPLPVSVWEDGCVWRKAGLDGLEAQGRDWRIAFQSAHISGQRAAILADLAVAPIPVSSLGGGIVEAKSARPLPKLPDYALGLYMSRDPSAPVRAAADHLRAGFAG